ncbi:MAG: type and secretion system protein [Verrucomicrobiales bacterium]|nr:type and secretion system protein [Verrucomicrobiales bacterium]
MRKPVLKLQSQALIVGIACAATIPIPVLRAGTDNGGYGYSSGIVEIEIAKRQKRISDAYLAEQEGDRLAAEQDYEGAIAKYREALDLLPLGTQNAADRNRVTAKYAKVCVIHARELGHRGAFDKARALLNNVLSENVDPNNKDARELLKDLDDPDKFNIAMTEKHYQDTEEVRSLFRKGLGYYDLGQFNRAEEQFNRVLAIDPTNIAARRQLERSQREVSNYLRAARDHTRLKMLNDVDRLWETSVPGTARVPTMLTERVEPTSGSQAITFKLNNITLDRIQFSDAGIEEVITYLKRKSIDADVLETDPARKGVDFILKGTTGSKPVTLDLRATKLLDAIKSVCDVAGMRYRLEPNAVIIMPLVGGNGEGGMVTKVFRVPPDFLSKGGGGGESGEAPAADPFASKTEGGGGSSIPSKPSAISILKNFGVDFPEGATATFSPGTSRLVVRNSLEQLDNVETVIDQMFKQSVKQVFITTKFVEVTQRNTDELGFDTLIGAFNLGSSGVFGSGGTTGNAGANSDFPFIDQNGTTTGANPISRGLRFGSEALSNNAIDALIAGGTSTGATAVSPGAFALAGVFTDPQFQIVMRALSQKKGVDLMTAPSVIARSGQRSKVEVIREFPYPTEFDPPQIPQTFGGGGGSLFGGDSGGGGGSFPVTPTTPQSFEFKNTGVTMEVEATVADDGYTIDLNLAPEVIEFEGFINYGSPIQTTSQNALGQNETLILTDNKILQPVFATRKLATQVMIWDRQTVGIGGLIREDVQSVEDKVPLFGDIPFLGRLFRTKSEEHFKKNLMIYVTGTLIDPQGQPLNESKTGDDEVRTETSTAPLFPPADVAPLTDK